MAATRCSGVGSPATYRRRMSSAEIWSVTSDFPAPGTQLRVYNPESWSKYASRMSRCAFWRRIGSSLTVDHLAVEHRANRVWEFPIFAHQLSALVGRNKVGIQMLSSGDGRRSSPEVDSVWRVTISPFPAARNVSSNWSRSRPVVHAVRGASVPTLPSPRRIASWSSGGTTLSVC